MSTAVVVDTTGSRTRRWLLAQQNNVVATPIRNDADTAHRLGREAYCLAAREIHDFELPEEVKKFREENDEKDLKVRLHLTFFDFAANSFYGNTYVSPNITLPDDDDAPWDLKQLMFFSTTRNSNKCYGVMEIVATTFDRPTATERTYSLAWSALPLFSHKNMKDMDEVDHEYFEEDDFDTSRLFAGTPRSLLFYGDDWKVRSLKNIFFFFFFFLVQHLTYIQLQLRSMDVLSCVFFIFFFSETCTTLESSQAWLQAHVLHAYMYVAPQSTTFNTS